MKNFKLIPIAIVCTATSAKGEEVCENFDFEALSRSIVQLTFMYDEQRPDGSIGHAGTAWFLDDTHLVTVGHITEDVLSTEWEMVTVGYGTQHRSEPEVSFEIPMRLVETIHGRASDYISIIEVQHGLLGAEPLPIRYTPPTQKDEPVVGAAYTGGILRYATGWYRIPESGSGEPTEQPPDLEGYQLFEVFDDEENDRYVFDHGASGSPILDCEGNVIAVTVNIFEYEMDFGITQIRVTTSWGSPNITGLPASLITPE